MAKKLSKKQQEEMKKYKQRLYYYQRGRFLRMKKRKLEMKNE